MRILPKSAFLNLCLGGRPLVTWGEFVYNLPIKGEVKDSASLTVPGHIKMESDTRSIARSVLHADLHSRAVMSWQLPLLNAVVNTVVTEVGTNDGDSVSGRGLKVTAVHKVPSAGYERLNFTIENTMALSNVDGSMTVAETAPLTGNYVLSCPTAWAHKMKLLVGGAADYLGNKLMNSLYVSGDTLGVQFIDSSSINLSVGGSGLIADVILDGATLQIAAGGLSLTTPATYIRTTGSFSLTGLLTLTQLPVCAAVPVINTELTNKLYVDTGLATKVGLTGNEVVAGIKTFSSFSITPSAPPTTDYQVANKKYVDDEIALNLGDYTDSGWIELTNGECLTSNTAIKTFIAAPAAGTVNIVYYCYAYAVFDTAAFAAAGADTYELHYTNLGGELIGFFAHTFLETGASVTRHINNTGYGNITTAAAIVGGTTTADLTLGGATSRIYFRFLYKTVALP